jgi:hypothetical protein
MVIDFIKEKYDVPNQERANYIYFNNVPNLARRMPEISKYFKDEHKINNFGSWDFIIFTKDTIFMNDVQYECSKILTLKKPKKIYSSFENIRTQTKNEKNKSLLTKILNNFDWKLK